MAKRTNKGKNGGKNTKAKGKRKATRKAKAAPVQKTQSVIPAANLVSVIEVVFNVSPSIVMRAEVVQVTDDIFVYDDAMFLTLDKPLRKQAEAALDAAIAERFDFESLDDLQ